MGILGCTPWGSGGPPGPWGQGKPPWQERPARSANAGSGGLDDFKGSSKTQTKKNTNLSSALTSP